MTFAATAIIGSAVIGGVASNMAADKTAGAIGSAADQATAEDRRQYEQTRTDYEDWRNMGKGAVANMQDPNAFELSPGYNFRRNEGMRNMDNRFSTGGGGGNAMRALNDYNQNMASNERSRWFGEQATMAGMGANATTGTAMAGDRASERIGNNYMTAGNARASGIQQKYGGWNNAMQSGISNAYYKWGGPPSGGGTIPGVGTQNPYEMGPPRPFG